MNIPPPDHFERVQRVFHSAADDYVEAFMDVSRYHAALNTFLGSLPPRAQVLEVGCGPGNITRYLLDQRPDLQILGIDLAAAMVERARQHCPEARFMQQDARQVEPSLGLFNGVVCGFLLPYLSEPDAQAFFHTVNRLLAPQGSFYLSTMEDDPAKSGMKAASSGKYEAIHQQFYQAEQLQQLLRTAGLRTVHMERASYPDARGENVTDLLLLATHA
ncbi:MAG: methyltransferase domain-containing protein [Flavobacteriales bacterium]